MSRSAQSIVLAVALVGLIFALDVYASYQVFTSKYPGANDFYSRWRGAQVYWQDGVNPYSDQATQAIQQGIYGRQARTDEDPGPFAYPFYTVFLLLPLVLVPYAWAEAIWLVILQFSLIGGVLLTLALINWRLPAWLMALTCLWAIIFYHSARTILLGQFAGLVFLCIAGVLLALKLKHQVMAGVLLALTTIKPQMSVLIVPGLLIWSVGQGRWRFASTFVATMAVLLAASFALLPGWLGQFWGQVTRYPSYTAIGSPVWIVAHYYLPLIAPWLEQSAMTAVEVGLSALLALYLLFQWRHLPRSRVDSGRFQWLVGLTIIITNLVVLRTATTNYVALYIPLIFGLKLATGRRPVASWLLALFFILSGVVWWTLFATTVVGKFEHPIMYLPLPVGLLLYYILGKETLQTTTYGANYGAD